MGKVIDRDMGWNSIKLNLKKIKGSYTKIGVLEGEKHFDSDSAELSEMVIIAAANEFGTRTSPERSFIRSAFDMAKSEINKFAEKLYPLYLKDPRKALALLGEFMQAKIQSRIVDLKTPPNAASTIKQKGSSNPLVDTAQLLQGITHVEVLA